MNGDVNKHLPPLAERDAAWWADRLIEPTSNLMVK
jgi:hypothetical protein